MTNNYRIIRSNELMHSDEFLGVDYSDGLKHWKYIKRYKGKNGKWQYVYADKGTHKEINRLISAKDYHDKAARENSLNASKARKEAHKKAIEINKSSVNKVSKSIPSDWSNDTFARLSYEDNDPTNRPTVMVKSGKLVTEYTPRLFNKDKDPINPTPEFIDQLVDKSKLDKKVSGYKEKARNSKKYSEMYERMANEKIEKYKVGKTSKKVKNALSKAISKLTSKFKK